MSDLAPSQGPEPLRPPVARIGVYPDGPLLVRGPVELVDESGRTIAVRRKTFALCRCGRTRTPPLCDGTHAAAGFRAPADGRDLLQDPAAGDDA